MSGIVSIRRLESGYWHIRGRGPCNWAQPQFWPDMNEAAIEASFFNEAAESFRRVVRAENERLLERDAAIAAAGADTT